MRIYAKGNCHLDRGCGEYTLLLESDAGDREVVKGKANGASVQAIIYAGILRTISRISNGSSVDVFSNVQMGWSSSKSKNKELIGEIKTVAQKRDIKLTFAFLHDFSEINYLLKVYSVY